MPASAMASQPEPPTVTSSAREIFLRALEAESPEACKTLVDTACGGDKVVRGEVESLLNEQGALGDFLESPAMSGLREPPKIGLPSREAIVKETSGDEIGPFKLLEPLGEGGCGTVYAAEQSSPVRRTVALKIIKLGMDTKQVIARFEAERQALAHDGPPEYRARLRRRRDRGRRPYFVMELVAGCRSRSFATGSKLSTGRAAAAFRPGLQRDPARAPEGDHPPRYEAYEYPDRRCTTASPFPR